MITACKPEESEVPKYAGSSFLTIFKLLVDTLTTLYSKLSPKLTMSPALIFDPDVTVTTVSPTAVEASLTVVTVCS